MSPEHAKPDDPQTPAVPEPPVGEPQEPPLTGVLTEEDIREIEAGGLTLGDVIRELEEMLARPPEVS